MNAEEQQRMLFKRMITDCLLRPLSKWEGCFITNLELAMQQGKVLTDKQKLKLENLWETLTDKYPTV
jgi:hypothetical protein